MQVPFEHLKQLILVWNNAMIFFLKSTCSFFKHQPHSRQMRLTLYLSIMLFSSMLLLCRLPENRIHQVFLEFRGKRQATHRGLL